MNMKNKNITDLHSYSLFLAALFVYFFFPIATHAGQTTQTAAAEVRIGVLAMRGKEKCQESWNATAEYLNEKIPDHSFSIVPLDFIEIGTAVKQKEISFIITHPAMYVSLEAHYGITRIATMKTRMANQTLTKLGGVIFTRSDRDDIRNVKDLKGKRFMAVDQKGFGGWQIGWRHFLDNNINPDKDFKDLSFGGTHDAVVMAVLNKSVDAGIVRTSLLEQMAQEGKIRLEQIRVLDDKSQTSPGFKHLHTTILYPEWPIAKVNHTDEELARKVTISLFQMQPADEAAKAAKMMGWTIPIDYQSVHDCLKRIKFDPYDVVEDVTLLHFLHEHRPWFIGLVLFLMLGGGTLLYFLRLNQRLRLTTTLLDRELDQRKQSEKNLTESHAKLDQIFNSAADGMREINLDREILQANSTFSRLVNLPMDQIIGKKCHEILPGADCHTDSCPLHRISNGAESLEYETEKTRPDGTIISCLVAATPFYNGSGELTGIIEDFRDTTAQKEAEKAQHRLQAQLLHAQKLESVGQLAAGIAHEINTPIQYIGTNIDFLDDGFKDVATLMSAYHQLLTEEKNHSVTPELVQKVEQTMKDTDWDYLAQELPLAIAQSKDGVHRVSTIVRAMKEFSHPGSKVKIPRSLNDLINTTLIVSRNEWKYVADLDTDFSDNLPQVPCLSDELGQVFLNLLVNSAHAIATQLGANPNGLKGRITISTRLVANQVEVRLQDTGCGIPGDILSRVFDPFFTTKDVGKGTGQGLAIARDVIVNKHGGTLEVESEPGQGATFIIRLSILSKDAEVSQ